MPAQCLSQIGCILAEGAVSPQLATGGCYGKIKPLDQACGSIVTKPLCSLQSACNWGEWQCMDMPICGEDKASCNCAGQPAAECKSKIGCTWTIGPVPKSSASGRSSDFMYILVFSLVFFSILLPALFILVCGPAPHTYALASQQMSFGQTGCFNLIVMMIGRLVERWLLPLGCSGVCFIALFSGGIAVLCLWIHDIGLSVDLSDIFSPGDQVTESDIIILWAVGVIACYVVAPLCFCVRIATSSPPAAASQYGQSPRMFNQEYMDPKTHAHNFRSW